VRLLPAACVLLILTATQAQIPAGYYSTATSTGYSLKTELYTIINGHTVVSYGALWTYYADTDIDPNDGYIWDMYSENPSGSDPYNFTLSTDQCGNYSGEASCYNREHSFPKSWFNDGSPMITDIHHVVPTDGYVNGQRSNLPYGEVASATFTSQNGSKKGSSATPGYSGTVFEPIDEYKGDFARIYFYMATRYENVITTWSSAMLDGSDDQVYETWALDMLIAWHNADPVDQKEIDRNDEIYYNVQGNRNPFVDHPEYVGSIWSSTSCSGVPATQVSSLSAGTISDVSATISWTSGDGSNRLVVVKQGAAANLAPSNSTTYTGVSGDFSSATDQGSSNYIVYDGTGGTVNITGLTASTTYHVQVFEYCSDSPNYNTTSAPTSSFTTSATPTNIQSEDFTTCISTTWTAQDESGTGTWDCPSGYMTMNGYGDGTSEDWLISPALNLDNFTNETFEFYARARYNGGTEIEVLYSTTYSGSGSPTGFTAIGPSNYSLPVAGTGSAYSSWLSSGNIDISGISGTSVYFAFKYTADGSGSGSEDWEVDDITISGVSAGSPCTEPTTQATSLNLTPSETQIDGSFTVSASADGYLIVESTSSSLGADPVDATSYNVGATIGSGSVIASQAGTSFSSSGLTSGTQYYYFIYAYNNSGCTGGPDYYLTSPLSGNATTTTPPACTEPTAQPTSLGLSVVGATQIDGSFTNAVGTPDGYLVIVSTNASYADTPTDATSYTINDVINDGTVVQASALNSFSATGLTASTQYYFYIFAYTNANCSGGPNYYVTSPLTGNATTDAVASSGTLFFQGFESGLADTWGIAAGSGNVSTSAGGTDTPASQRILTDANSWQVNNSTQTLTLNSVDVTGSSSMQVDAYLSSTSASGTNGAEASDYVEVYLDIDGGGFPVSPDITVTGFGGTGFNARWGLDASLTATTVAGTPVSLASPQTGTSTNNYAKIEITIPDGTTSVALQLEVKNNSSDEFWNIDDIALVGSAASCAVNTLTSFSPDTGTAGTRVTILGTNFNDDTGTSSVSFNGTAAASFSVISATEIEAVIASGSGTGQVTVTTDGCANTSTQSFTLIENDCAAGISDLFITEYVEGSSNNKYLEIYNGTGSSVDLSNYDLVQYNNGSSTVTYTLALSGTLADDDVYIIEKSTENLSVMADLSTSNNVMAFNGDDVIALRKNGVNIDIIGKIGEDPGTQWGSGDASTGENTIRRKSSVTQGDSDGSDDFDPATEWDGYPQDNVVDMGSFTSSVTGTPPVITVNPTNQNECSTASFSVAATGTVDSYQWKVFDGDSWASVSDGGFYSGAATATLSISNINGSIDGYQFYCELVESGVCTNVTTTTQLTVFGADGTIGEWGGGTSSDWTDCKNWANGEIPIAASNITIPNTGTNPQVATNLSINNLIINSGATLEISAATTLTVVGDLTVNATGALDGNDATSNITLTGTQNNLTMSGTLEPSTDINIGSGAEIALSADMDLPNESNDLTVLSGGILDFNGFNATGTSGDFFLNAGGSIKITSADGITTAGNGTGNVQTDTRTFSTSADYYFTAGTTQVSGDAFPSTVNDLNVAKTSNAVTLSNSVTVNGDVSISGTGNLVTGANTLTLGGTSTISGEDGDSYIEGRVSIVKAINNTTDSPGNMGVSLTTSDDLGSTIISRTTGTTGIVTEGPHSGIAARWSITPTTQPTGTVTGTFEWLSALDNSIDLNNLEVWKNSGSGWAVLNATTNVGSGDLRSVTFSTTSFSDFTITDDGSPLPVELTDFFIKNENEQLVLYWSTASETNNEGFEIQKSVDGREFNTIGFVAGQGTTSASNSYNFSSSHLSCGAYYRLKQVDFDGAFEFSPVLFANCQLKTIATIYPNPVESNQLLKIDMAAPLDGAHQIEVAIYALSGISVLQKEVKLANLEKAVNDQLLGLPNGQYLLQLKFGGQVVTHRFVKQ